LRQGRTRAVPAREHAQGTHCDHADPAAEPERDRPGDPSATVEPNDAGLIAGRHYKVSDLSNALLLLWVNDAAVGHGPGDWPFSTGVALMNGETHHLQAYDVVAKQAERPARRWTVGVRPR
jgi:hypothetical protein